MNSPRAEELVLSAVDTLPIRFAILDDEGSIRYTNRAWQEFGERNGIETQSDMIGVNYLDVAAQSKEDTAQTATVGLSEILAGERELFELEYPCHSPDERRWFLMRAAPFTHGDSRFVAVAHTNITERREYQRKVEQSNERLEQFAYAAAHDLREPLRTVTSFLELLEEQYAAALDEDGREFIEFAVDGADRMRDMIDGLLKYSRVDTRGDPFEPVDLEEVFGDVRRDLQVKIEDTGAEITAEDLPEVYGDEGQLRQVFLNLLSNAIEYSGDESPRIHVTSERDDAADDWVISVRDEGIGIAPEDADRVFELFQSLQGREAAGTGIGLALVKRIVERHGGDIWIDSELGDHAVFSFTLSSTPDDES